jgi:hypothetical protein
VQKGRDLSAAITVLSPAYAPVDTKFTIANLNTAITTSETANADVAEKEIPYTDAVSDRYTLAKSIGPLVTQSLAYVKSNTAWANRYDAVKDAADKVRGIRPPKAKSEQPDPEAKKRESGEQSYDEIAGFLKTYIGRLEALVGYAPQDAKIGIAALSTAQGDLNDYNRSIPSDERILTDSISDRLLTFTGPAGLKFVFDGVKASVKGQYGQSSPEYKSVSGIGW